MQALLLNCIMQALKIRHVMPELVLIIDFQLITLKNISGCLTNGIPVRMSKVLA